MTQSKPKRTAQDYSLWAALPMANTSLIEGRLHLILDKTRSRRQTTRRVLLAALALSAALLVPLAMLQPAARAQGVMQTAGRSGLSGATAQLKQIYHFITVYRGRHNSVYPETGSPTLFMDMIAHPQSYGLPDQGAAGNKEQVRHLFTSPDSQFMDGAGKAGADNLIVYFLHHKRPDGTLVGTAKRAGTRDVFAYANLYVRNHPHGATGFYLVLWDNGMISKIPASRIRVVPVYDVLGPMGAIEVAHRQGAKQIAFPGQAGLPRS